MSRIYEAMFLIDNDSVRASWQQAKVSLTGLIEKHGGKVCTARRWNERRLAYPVRRRNRATYMLTFLDLDQSQIPNLHRDLEISELVLRYLFLRADTVPAEEVDLSNAESADDFVVPEPPADDAIDEPEPEEEAPRGAPEAEGEKKEEAKPAETPAEAPAEEPAPVAAETTAEPEKTEG